MLNTVLSLGRYLLVLPAVMFGLGHFMAADAMAGMVPIPGGVIWVYLTGVAHIATAVSVIIGKWDKLATALWGLMLLIFALAIHLPGWMGGGDGAMASQGNFLKDVMIAGGAWVYAACGAKDKAVIG